MQLDAAFEAVLGVTVLACAASGALDGSDFPRPVGTVVLLVAGIALLVLAGVIWSGRLGLNLLAYGNGAAALAGLAWLLGVSGWSELGATVVGATVGGLAVLAAAQAATLRR